MRGPESLTLFSGPRSVKDMDTETKREHLIGAHDKCSFNGVVESEGSVWWCPVCAKLFWEGMDK